MNFNKLFFIHFLYFIEFYLGENTLSKCTRKDPFLLSDSTCANFENVCLKTNEERCINLLNACQQCPSSNYTLPLLLDVLTMFKNEIYEIRQNQTNEIKTIKSSFELTKTYFIKEIKFFKKKSNNNETLIIKQKIDQLTSTIESAKIFFTKEIDFFKVNSNKNESLALTQMIDQLTNFMIAFRKNLSVETATSTKKLDNKIFNLQNQIEKLSGIIIAVIVIEILLFIILLLEVRFKLISKFVDKIQKCEDPNPRACRANGPLMQSRKINSLNELKNELVILYRDDLVVHLTELKGNIANFKSEITNLISSNQMMNYPNCEENMNGQSKEVMNNLSDSSRHVISPDEMEPLIPEEASSSQ